MLATLLASLFACAGCITTSPRQWIRNGFKVGPNYLKPPAPVADQWIGAADGRVDGRHLQDWWRVFDDATLNGLINTAYNQNLTLRVLGTRVLEARAQQAIAVGNIFPQSQEALGFYSYASLAGDSPHINFTGFNLSWELDFWGRFRRNIETANAKLDASVEDYDDALVTLLADVATNYVQYRVAQQRIKIAHSNVAIQEQILTLVEEQERVGINHVTRLDVEQARTVLGQTRSSIPDLQIVQGQANDRLCVLLGMAPRDLEAELGPGPPIEADPVGRTPLCVAAGIPADLLRMRPDVRSAERQIAAQSAQIGVAEADLYPSLAINGILGYEDLNFPRLFESNGFFGAITPSFGWKILNYGRIRNNVRLQQARMQEMIVAYQSKVLSAGREAQTSLRGFLRSREQSDELARSVVAAKGALNIGRDQYRVGVIPFNTIFNLETTQVQQQDNLAIAQGNIAINLINVYRALGGGWEIRLEQNQAVPGPPMPPPPANQPPVAPPEAVPTPQPRPDAKPPESSK